MQPPVIDAGKPFKHHRAYGQMRINSLKFILSLVIVLIVSLLCGCTENSPKFGIWNAKPENREYVLLTDKDASSLGEIHSAPFHPSNKQQWTRVKDIGESIGNIKPTLKPYSAKVVESSYAFLQSTINKDVASAIEDIEWGWKIEIENNTKRNLYAYGGYSLFDKDGFVLTRTGIDWDNDEAGVLIKAGKRGTVQGKASWRISRATTPYPPSRVVRGDYKLYLRYDIWEIIAEQLPPAKK